jgi:5'-nucleotidase
MKILLTNDDGVYAPGLAALEAELQTMGDVTIVAPATEQSGVGHSITFLAPLICHEIYQNDRRRGWAVEGSPADCVKVGVFELCPEKPDIVVSGINGGLNAGINVLYSGTVAAAIEGAFFGLNSFAVSLQYDEHARFDVAARIARLVIQQILDKKGSEPELYNINIPTIATTRPSEVHVVPMGLERFGEEFLKRKDPKGRTYYWATGEPPPMSTDRETDLAAIQRGFVTVTPLRYDMTRHERLAELSRWGLHLKDLQSELPLPTPVAPGKYVG